MRRQGRGSFRIAFSPFPKAWLGAERDLCGSLGQSPPMLTFRTFLQSREVSPPSGGDHLLSARSPTWDVRTHARRTHAARTGHVGRMPARRWRGRRPTNLCGRPVGPLPAEIISVGFQKQLMGHAPGGISALISRLHRRSLRSKCPSEYAAFSLLPAPSLCHPLPTKLVLRRSVLQVRGERSGLRGSGSILRGTGAERSIPMLGEIWD